MATTQTIAQTKTVTYPRKILILSSIRLAYKEIMLFSDEQYKKWIDAFENEELESVTFYAVTTQNGKKKKLIELSIGIDWDMHRELVKLVPDVTLMDTPEHKQGVTIAINEAINTYLKLFKHACTFFPDCTSEDWYRCSSKIRTDSQLWAKTRKKLGLNGNSSPPPPYSSEVNENSYDMSQLAEMSSRLKTYF